MVRHLLKISLKGRFFLRKKIYSAGLVSQRFWFYEIKDYIYLLNQGNTEAEIKEKSKTENIFGSVSSSRASEIYNGARRRVKVLGEDMQILFPKLTVENQKIVVLISVLLLNNLFLEFMQEVVQVKMGKGELKLSSTDFKSFFSEKQRSNEVVAGWKPYTYNRLGSAYRNYLVEAGLLRGEGMDLVITPKMLDPRLVQWLKSINRIDIARALTGGNLL